MDKILVDEMSWSQFREAMAANDLIIMPIGSTEAHGPHNPLGTDTFIASDVAEAVGRRVKAPVAPPMPVGNALGLIGFPGTANIGAELLHRVLLQVCESFANHGAKRFLFINGHGGNASTLRAVSANLFADLGVLSVSTEWWTTLPHLMDIEIHEHGGLYETSFALKVAEDSVDLAKVPEESVDEDSLGQLGLGRFEGVPLKRPYPMGRVHPLGYFGSDVMNASKETGEDLFDKYVEFCVGLAEELRRITL